MIIINKGMYVDKLRGRGQKEPKTKVNWLKLSPSKSYSDGDEKISIPRR